MDYIKIKEYVKWLSSSCEETVVYFSQDILVSWLKIGPSRKTATDFLFCDPEIVIEVSKLKNMLNVIDEKRFLWARSKCNPFEGIGRSIFLNRSAVKMANLDAILDFMFTDPKDENDKSIVKNDLLYFADCCAGPGGFSQYILFRKEMQAKGFGFTLRNDNDFQLDQFLAGNTAILDIYYGVKGDGNILDPENIESLTRHVMNKTCNIGVHFMMADGGFYVEEGTSQEIACKQLHLCECIVALSLVREGGSFVIKFFDLLDTFTVGLVYLMYKCFKQMSIIKPNASRPANSERYIVFKYKTKITKTIQQHLFHVNEEIWNTNADIIF